MEETLSLADVKERRERATMEINRLCAAKAGCEYDDLPNLMTAAGITGDTVLFSREWSERLPGGFGMLKHTLRSIAEHRKEYNRTGRGFYPLQAFILSKRNILPSPFWVEEWLYSGLVDYDRTEGKSRLDELLCLSPGKQGAANEWQKNLTKESEQNILIEIADLVYACGFGIEVARVIVGKKWGLKPETIKEYQKRHTVLWSRLKKDPFTSADDVSSLLAFIDMLGPHFDIIFEEHPKKGLLSPLQREKARIAYLRILEREMNSPGV